MDVYPLTFQPIFKPKIWGGRKLETALGKTMPPGMNIGESWEVSDLPDDRSVVAAGPARGQTLEELVRTWGPALYGKTPLSHGRFPLLLKFLDAREALSVQVHPHQAAADAAADAGEAKHEAWYVVEAAPQSVIYRGLRAGVGPRDLRDAIGEGRVESLLNRIPARKGRAYYLPGGTIHALGAGVLAAEVQTPSDVTYRVYDWDRIDPATHAPRALHVNDALACMTYDGSQYPQEEVQHIASVWTAVTHLIRCESFAVDRVRMVAGMEQDIPIDGFLIWMILEGRCTITCAGYGEPFSFGRKDTVLIPAGITKPRVQTHEPCMWLEVSIPRPSSVAGFDRPERESPRHEVEKGSGFVNLGLPGKPEE